ncbi:MAG: hypothetical protein WDM92_00825 [Caulobacteraceae bacterium]
MIMGLAGRRREQPALSARALDWFDRHRGLALSLAGSGTALGFRLRAGAHPIAEGSVWLAGRVSTAWGPVICVTLPTVGLFLRERPAGVSDPYEDGARDESSGIELRQAVRGTGLLAVGGHVHERLGGALRTDAAPRALLTDKGFGADRAAQIASLFGLAAFIDVSRSAS